MRQLSAIPPPSAKNGPCAAAEAAGVKFLARHLRLRTVVSMRAEQARAQRRDRKRCIALWYTELKRELACSVCGETHPACVQFHHADADSKELSIADAVRRGWGRARIVREIEKCVVLCANCHAKHHARENTA